MEKIKGIKKQTEAMERIVNEDGQMLCPICQFEYVHMEGIGVNRMGEIMVVDGNDPVDIFKGEPCGRGSCVVTYFYCEAGHRWKEVRQFNKGNTYEEIVRMPDVTTKYWRMTEGPEELTRD